MHHFSFVLSINSGKPEQVLMEILEEVIGAIKDGEFWDSYVEADHTGQWRFWEASSGTLPNRPETPSTGTHPDQGV